LPVSPVLDGALSDHPDVAPVQRTLNLDGINLRPVTCIIGAFGSGKTEVAINLALAAAKHSNRVCLVDLDTVTPAFRTRQVAAVLDSGGVRLIAPAGQLAYADLPAVPPEVRGALGDPSQTVLLDVGGNPAGAKSLGSLTDLIRQRDYDCWAVISPWRPDTRDPEQAAGVVSAVTKAAGLPVTGLVANLHIPFAPSEQDYRAGVAVVRSAAAQLDTELVMCAIPGPMLAAGQQALGPGLRWLGLNLYMRAPWDQLGGLGPAGSESDEL
jgi:hypothetical protein